VEGGTDDSVGFAHAAALKACKQRDLRYYEWDQSFPTPPVYLPKRHSSSLWGNVSLPHNTFAISQGG